jgi:hypothetical protein
VEERHTGTFRSDCLFLFRVSTKLQITQLWKNTLPGSSIPTINSPINVVKLLKHLREMALMGDLISDHRLSTK